MNYSISIYWILLVTSTCLHSQNISQWRGPDRSGVYDETYLSREWRLDGPDLLWTAGGIGKGYSSASVTEDAIYTSGRKDTTEYLTALDPAGQIQWQIPMGSAWTRTYPDSRSTPTVEDGSVYVLSGRAEISCVDASNGRMRWSINAAETFEAKHHVFGVSESLLLVDDKVVYTPCGDKTTIVALDKKTGETVWMSESLHDSAAYASPILIQYAGKKIIVNVTCRYILGVDASDGTMLWHYRYIDLDTPLWHPWAPVENMVTPIYHDGHFYVTSGCNHVGALFKLSDDASSIQLVWKDSTLDCHFGGVVLVDGHIYGSNWINNQQGNWVCLDWNTGDVMYEKEWKTKGSIISADGMLYCYEEKRGHVALVEATPEDFKIVDMFRVKGGSGPHWAHPTIHKGVLYIRHGDALLAYDIKK